MKFVLSPLAKNTSIPQLEYIQLDADADQSEKNYYP
jgi:hypothetical protein